METATRRQLVGIAGLGGFAAAMALALSPSTVIAGLEGLAARPLLFLFALLLVYLIRPFLLWPVTSIALVLGFLYGPVIALPLALAGAAVTAMPPYLLGLYYRTEIGLFGYVQSAGVYFVTAVGPTRGVVAARFSPVPGDPISYAAGLAGMRPRPFLVGTVVGEVPWALVAVITGASMRALTVSEFAVSPQFLLALAGLAILVLAGPLYNHVVASPTPE